METAGRILERDSGVELATAEGTYVAAGEEQKQRLRERYGFRFLRDADARTDAADMHDAVDPTASADRGGGAGS